MFNDSQGTTWLHHATAEAPKNMSTGHVLTIGDQQG